MGWKIENTKYFIEQIIEQEDKPDSRSSIKYTLGEYSSQVPIFVPNDSEKITLFPYKLESLKQNVDEEYPNGTINEIHVGIRNDTDISYIVQLWTPKEFNGKNIREYNFRDNEPSGSNFGHISGPNCSPNHGPRLDKKMMKHFIELSKFKPQVAGNLEKCLIHLTNSRPGYAQNPNKEIKVSLEL